MGLGLSRSINRKRSRELYELSQAESSKRLRIAPGDHEGASRLIQSLPDEISLQILARLPRIHYIRAKSVSRRWRDAITSPELYQLRRELGTTEHWLYILSKVSDNKLLWHGLDPVSRKWQRLPPMPDSIYVEESTPKSPGFQMWNLINGWIGRRKGLDQTPFCGCSTGVVDGCLYVLGGFSRDLAMKCVWRYDPRVNSWQEVSSMTTARAFCKTAMLNDKLYVVGGVSKGAGGVTPLKSSEVFDPCTGTWTSMPSMPFLKAHELPIPFLADMLKPIATGMASYKGMLCVPQSLYSWSFFIDIGGEVFDPRTNSWGEMSVGMGEGWPARQAGTKLSVVVDGELYALEPTTSLDSGKIKIYDQNEDAWKVIIEKAPVHDFIQLECPYLLAGFQGKLHVITKDDNSGTTIFQTNLHINTPPPSNSMIGNPLQLVEETNVWSVVGAKDLGPGELVNSQVLDV